MYKKILVAIDRSPMHRDVFNQALSLAKANWATLMLLHVLSEQEEGSPVRPISYPYYDPMVNDTVEKLFQEQWEAFRESGLKMLESFADEAIAAGVNTEYSQLSGNPDCTICDLAQTWNADLIVVGRRGYSGLKELFLGSVSNYVTHHASCSVLIVHAPVPVDSKSSESRKENISH